jgi:ankyrin repeat protein
MMGPICASIHDQAFSGNAAAVRFRLDCCAEVDCEDRGRCTPLVWACMGGKDDVVRLLLERGACVEARDDDGRTALMHAAREGFTPVVDVLLTKVGCTPNALRRY